MSLSEKIIFTGCVKKPSSLFKHEITSTLFTDSMAISVIDKMRKIEGVGNLSFKQLRYHSAFSKKESNFITSMKLQQVTDFSGHLDKCAEAAKVRHIIDKISQVHLLGDIVSSEAIPLLQSAIDGLDLGLRASSAHSTDIAKGREIKAFSAASIADNGYPTGWQEFDAMKLIRPKELIIIGARPSIGKTTLLMNLVNKLCEHGLRGCIFSLETTGEQLQDKQIMAHSGVPYWRTQNGVASDLEVQRQRAAIEIAGKQDIDFWDKGRITIEQLKDRVYRSHSRRPLGFIALDYIQNMKFTSDSKRHLEIGEASSVMKELAVDLNVPFICLAQLKREAETDTTLYPSHIKDSGSIEQDADVVILMRRNRREQVSYNSGLKEHYEQEGVIRPPALKTMLAIAKNRNATTGVVDLFFDPEIQRFCDDSYRDF